MTIFETSKRVSLRSMVRKAERRASIRKILDDPVQRKELMIRAIVSMQAMEGIETTREEAAAAYDIIQAERRIAWYIDRSSQRPWYVAQLPGDGGVDWGYEFTVDKALPLPRYWQRRFRADCARCGRIAQFAPV